MNIGALSGYNPFYMPMQGINPGVSVGSGADAAEDAGKVGGIKNPGESTIKEAGRKSSPAECETCKERKYVDGSDEMVSFKAPSHISPEASAAKVRGHEQEHVSNAYKKASQADAKVLQASVSLKTAICPECGRSYVAGGLTTTKIKYGGDPYSQNRKSADSDALVGANFDKAV